MQLYYKYMRHILFIRIYMTNNTSNNRGADHSSLRKNSAIKR